MANVLSVYDPLFYASEAVILLYNSLGMARRVFRDYDKAPQQKGSVIQIRKPGTFTAQAAPSSAQDISASFVQVVLNNWFEVKFALTDKELSYTTDVIISEHITPAVYALANKIDADCFSLVNSIPWYVQGASPAAVGDLSALRRQMFINKVPENDGNLHLAIDGVQREQLTNLQAFSQFQGAGPAGVETQMKGTLGERYGFEIFADQNVPIITPGSSSVTALKFNGGGSPATVGQTSINVSAVSVTGTVAPGDSFTVAGDTQRYAITNSVTASANQYSAVTFLPAAKVAWADQAVLTLTQGVGTNVNNVAFHRNAFALAMAPLPEIGNELGAKIATSTEPFSGLSVRSRMFYVGDTSKVYVALDVLYGLTVLDPNLACRYIR